MDLVSFVTIRDGKVFPKANFIVKQPAFYLQKNNKGKVTRKRSIQYVPSLESVFVDEQLKVDPNAVRENIVIKKRPLVIDRDLFPQKVDFLERHEDFGEKFKILDLEQEQLFELKEMAETDDAKSYLLKADANVIRAIAIELISPAHGQTKRISDLRLTLRDKADKSIDVVNHINSFSKDNFNQEKLMVTTLLSSKVIKLEGKTFSWTNSDEKIYTASQAHDAPRELAVWLKNDEEGRQTQAIFLKSLEKLK